MEIIFVLGAIWVGLFLLGRIGSFVGAAANAVLSGESLQVSQPGAFEARVSRTTIEIDDTPFPVFRVEVKGPISAPVANFPIQFVMHAFDVTDGDAKPIFCALEWMQELTTPILEYRTDVSPLPYEHSIISDWAAKAQIPLDMITLPRSGSRQLEFRVQVVSGDPETRYVFGEIISGTVLVSATVRTTIAWTEIGYEETGERRARVEELTLHLAMAVSAADGSMDRAEGAVIRSWLAKRIEGIEDEDTRSGEKRRLNGLVTTAYRLAATDELDPPAMCRELTEIADPAARYDALELCLHVAAADGRAEEVELKTIRQLGDWMGVSLERLRTMEQKILPVSMHVGQGDDDSLLGLKAAMSEGELRKHLNREYRKWNSLASHADPQKREQAQEMLSRIAAARRRHVT